MAQHAPIDLSTANRLNPLIVEYFSTPITPNSTARCGVNQPKGTLLRLDAREGNALLLAVGDRPLSACPTVGPIVSSGHSAVYPEPRRAVRFSTNRRGTALLCPFSARCLRFAWSGVARAGTR